MADVAILASQVQATPNGYTIPGGQEIIVKSIRVSFDGSGAAGSFVPVLQLVAPGQSGTIVSEYPLESTLAAGASADITWFPGVKAAPSRSSSITTVIFDYTLPADAATIDTLTSGPSAGTLSQAFSTLQVWIIARTTDLGGSGNPQISVVLNNDSGANYDQQYDFAVANVDTPGFALAATYWSFSAHGNYSTALYPGTVRFTMPGYAQTSFYKVAEALTALPDAIAGNQEISMQSLGWRSTAAVNRITVGDTSGGILVAGSRLLILGS